MILKTSKPYYFSYEKLRERIGNKKYRALEKKVYYSKRYNKYITVSLGYLSDGATGAPDIKSFSWWVHDVICDKGIWDDGTKITNWQASMVLKDILKEEGRWEIDHWWFIFTWLLGGGKARDNRMI